MCVRICWHAVDDPAGQEVADRAGFGGRERVRAAIRDRGGIAARPPATAPFVAEVPIEVGADVARPRGRLAVLAPVVEVPVGDVVLGAVRVDVEDHPDLAAVDDVRDPRVVAVAVDEPVHDPERHLDAHVLVGVRAAVEEHLGLVLIDADVVRDLQRPHRSTLVGRPDAEPLGDGRMRRRRSPSHRPRRSW